MGRVDVLRRPDRSARWRGAFIQSASVIGMGAFLNQMAVALTHLGPLPGITHGLLEFLLGMGSLLMVLGGMANLIAIAGLRAVYRSRGEPEAVWVRASVGIWIVGAVSLVLFLASESGLRP